MIRTFSRINSISVISKAGSESVRGISDMDSVSRTLGVGYLVRGNLESTNGRVRVSYELDSRTGRVVDEGSVTVSRDSLLHLQDDLTSRVAELVRRQLGGEIAVQSQRAATTSDAAWLAVQDGAQLQRRADASQAAGDTTGLTERLFADADSAYARAEVLDSKWPEPSVRRAALAYRRSRLVGRNPALIRPWLLTGIAHADRALKLDPDDTDALENRGTMRFWGVLSGTVAGAEAQEWLKTSQVDLERATSLNNAQAGAWATLAAAYYQIPGKQLADVILAAKAALAADEFQTNAILIRSRLNNAAYDNGQFDEADRYCKELEVRHPGNVRSIRCRLYLQSIPDLPSYDIPRAWRLVDSLVEAGAPRDSTLARFTGGMFVAATIARAALVARPAEKAAALRDSARAVARRSEGDAMLDQPRELMLFGAMAANVLGDKDDLFRRLSAYIAVSPEARANALRADPGWWFKSVVETPEWKRLVGR